MGAGAGDVEGAEMSDTRRVHFSTVNDPDRWDTQEHGVIVFANPEEAKKAETLFNSLDQERRELIEALEILDNIGDVVLPLHQNRNASNQTIVMGWDKVSLRLGHLRKARALLARLKNESSSVT